MVRFQKDVDFSFSFVTCQSLVPGTWYDEYFNLAVNCKASFRNSVD